jgi:signal transduction histidine kinase
MRVRRSLSLRTMPLRTKVTLIFGLIALIASVSLTVVTYTFARSSLLDQRATVAERQAIFNAREVQQQLESLDRRQFNEEYFPTVKVENEGFASIRLADGTTNSTSLRLTDEQFPDELRAAVAAGSAGVQQFEIGGDPYMGVGINIAEPGAEYYEAFQLRATEGTLQSILLALVIGSAITVLLATIAGWWTSRRLLRPLGRVTDAAGEIAAGSLDTRVPREGDPDLDRLGQSFNEMADAVQARIEREARFASDVSHELRSPITALSAAVEVIDGRRGQLPTRTQQALDVVVSQVRRFDAMVIDLLELSRLDAGAHDLHLEDVDIEALTRRVAARYGFADIPVEVDLRSSPTALLDKMRYERILANLLENARYHGGGPLRISIEPNGADVVVAVEDGGPGVARGEQARIFERFARGSAARHRIGTGLGLALVAEHAAAQGGEAWVEDRPGGGARFVVRFPSGVRR